MSNIRATVVLEPSIQAVIHWEGIYVLPVTPPIILFQRLVGQHLDLNITPNQEHLGCRQIHAQYFILQVTQKLGLIEHEQTVAL